MYYKNIDIKLFSKHLFWDVDKSAIDLDKNYKYVINNTLLYGLYSDWKIILNYYGLKKIVDVAIKSKQIDKKTASFISLISKTPQKEFLCFSTKQSIPKHWSS
jgi:hypothetical protein